MTSCPPRGGRNLLHERGGARSRGPCSRSRSGRGGARTLTSRRRAPGSDRGPRRGYPSAVLDVAVRNDELLVDEANLATLAHSEPVVVAEDAHAIGEPDDGDPQ